MMFQVAWQRSLVLELLFTENTANLKTFNIFAALQLVPNEMRLQVSSTQKLTVTNVTLVEMEIMSKLTMVLPLMREQFFNWSITVNTWLLKVTHMSNLSLQIHSLRRLTTTEFFFKWKFVVCMSTQVREEITFLPKSFLAVFLRANKGSLASLCS